MQLTLDFYKRNYIEGLFLSSGIIRNPDYTMEQVVEVARQLRIEHDFRGYIHLKTIPEASRALIDEAGRYADRISINLELPTHSDLQQLAPEKHLDRIESGMQYIHERVQASAAERQTNPSAPVFAAAGQSTQLIVGVTPTPDHIILNRASSLYTKYRLRRVYYSAFSPIPHPSVKLPLRPPPLVREHRLYQADWLMRFYGFAAGELAEPKSPNLDLLIDPKLAWALRHRDFFPVSVNSAPRFLLLRIPGLGVRNVDRILKARRLGALRLKDLLRLRVSLQKAGPFIETPDWHPNPKDLESDALIRRFTTRSEEQLDLFAPTDPSVHHGQF